MNQNILTSDINARVRAIESKYNQLAEKLLTVNRNMIEEFREVIEDTKRISKEIKEIKLENEKIKTAIKNMVHELQFFAKTEDLKALEKYINLWNPLEFVTAKELDKTLKEVKKHSKKRK